jgi:hypothetical protein
LALLAGATAIAAPKDWWGRVAEDIRSSEYEITWEDSAWQAPNRAHGFRTYFTEAGIRVVPRTSEGPSWEWGLSLIEYGRSADAHPPEPARVHPKSRRIEYDRGSIVEWYVNGPEGLEQGFTLARPPNDRKPSDDAADPLRLAMSMAGGLVPAISEDGMAVDFAIPGGRRLLHYAGLAVTDAAGRSLPARMEGFAQAGARGIRIVVDDRNAVYPVTIDPLATSWSWSVESDQGGAQLGLSAAGAGDVNGDGYSDVVVAAPFYDGGQTDEGRVFVFHGSTAGLGANPAWTAEANQTDARFGSSVAAAGDVNGDGYSDLAVGAPLYDNGQTDEGRAFVYHGSASGLSATASWTAEADQAAAQFGYAISSAGDVDGDHYSDLIVGAPFYDNGQTDEGIARLYRGSAAGLSGTPAITLERNQALAELGSAVAGGGDVNGDGYSDVFVGSRRYDYTHTDEGAVWFYPGSAGGLVDSPRGIVGGQANALWGASVAIVGDVNGDGYADAVVGAPLYDSPEVDEGIANLLYGDPGGPVTGPIYWQCDQAGAELGSSVSSAGDVNGDGFADVLLGAPKFDGGEMDEGKIFLIYGIVPGLVQWSAEGNQAGAQFGRSAALAGDVNGDGYSDVLVGEPLYDNGQADEGRAVVYHGSPDGLVNPGWSVESNQASAQLGYAVASAGDVNGDAFADVVVGAPLFDSGQADEGKVFVYLGSATGLSVTAAWTAESNQAAANFGAAVAGARDVNGDGYDDVAVGARTFDNGQIDEGRVFVYHGSPTGLSATANWTAESNQASANFGCSVGSAGDVNGDGYADLIVGARTFDNGQIDEGRAFVYHGSASGLSAAASWTGEADQGSADYGVSVASAGDVNRDGYSDVIVGADKYDAGQTDEGRAFVYHGSSSGLSATANWTAESNQVGIAPAPAFGFCVASAGDINGDGYSDVIVGAPYFDNGADNEGVAFLYYGTAVGLNATPGWTCDGQQTASHLGYVVGSAGDVNGDGFADVFAGAPHYDLVSPAAVDAGMVIVTYGSAAGPVVGTSDVYIWGDQANSHFGWSAASAGDVNGDGFAELVVGSPDYDAGQTDEGRFHLFDGGGWQHAPGARPQQRRADDASPVGLLGSTGDATGFRVTALARGVLGRGRVKLEWRVAPLGTDLAFGTTGTSAAWADTGTSGASLDEPVSGLTVNRVYHWRARVRYDLAASPTLRFSRWFAVPLHGWQEGDLRTVCTTAAPTGFAAFAVAKSSGAAVLTWTTVPRATAYDLVRGDLSALRASAGDFTTATERCLADDIVVTNWSDADTPATEHGYWYVVRGVNCGGVGSYDSGAPSQPASRDAEIAASGNACP